MLRAIMNAGTAPVTAAEACVHFGRVVSQCSGVQSMITLRARSESASISDMAVRDPVGRPRRPHRRHALVQSAL
jgi:hypothetical protein